ncbi:SgcJ/EcaC family oxidoreductase [Nocardioides sp. SYSU D00038]|uniref:YybH family protein n=1 Tax=Nocardioides sp. SYSU D00038 TaxID=2812554 RepID=UPI0019675177|nr:SgcJ/EcaC family oxidoreductase [Nocardioides sp. SYSU D00038]
MTLTASSELAAVTAVIDDLAAALDARDPDRVIARVAPDARFVTGAGVRVVGRAAVRQAHVDVFASGGTPPGARFPVVDLQMLRPDVAVVTTEAVSAASTAPSMVVTWTLVREDDGWWVAGRTFTPIPPR